MPTTTAPDSFNAPWQLSDAAKVKRLLNYTHHDRWGFVFYRCAYGDDAAWGKFNNIIRTRAREQILGSDKPELLDTLEWTIFDDRETFNEASADALHKHFDRWVAGNW